MAAAHFRIGAAAERPGWSGCRLDALEHEQAMERLYTGVGMAEIGGLDGLAGEPSRTVVAG